MKQWLYPLIINQKFTIRKFRKFIVIKFLFNYTYKNHLNYYQTARWSIKILYLDMCLLNNKLARYVHYRSSTSIKQSAKWKPQVNSRSAHHYFIVQPLIRRFSPAFAALFHPRNPFYRPVVPWPPSPLLILDVWFSCFVDIPNKRTKLWNCNN